tara:strand:+ start:27481 stop:27675 length:195 start_codon:yes stop_codon:yes gene_type:complete
LILTSALAVLTEKPISNSENTIKVNVFVFVEFNIVFTSLDKAVTGNQVKPFLCKFGSSYVNVCK